MAVLPNPAVLIDRLRSTYWFVPAVLTTGAVALALSLTALDRWFPDATSWIVFAYAGGADGARALLSAVAGSTITVVSVTFSVLVVALTVSSQHFGPRLLNSFMRDNGAQLVLGTLTGTYAYCLVVLRTVQGADGDGYAAFVPHLAVTGALLLTLISVAMLIYYVHHVAISMQVSEITAGVARELERTIERLYPERLEEVEPTLLRAPVVPDRAIRIDSIASGYVQGIEHRAILDLASAHGTTVWLTSRVGDFATAGVPLAMADPAPADRGAFSDRLRRAYTIGADRTPYQDAAFGVQQLVEVALRALSPGVNEPFTAITAIDRLGQGLNALVRRAVPSAVLMDEARTGRVVSSPRTFPELLQAAVEPVAIYADRNPAIAERLLQMLRMLAAAARRPEDRAAVGRAADFVVDAAQRHLEDREHRARIEARRTQVIGALLRPAVRSGIAEPADT